jgi:transposase
MIFPAPGGAGKEGSMLRMGQILEVRQRHFLEGESIRKIAREMGITRPTVRKYLRESEAIRKETTDRGQPVRGAVGPRIEGILEEWSDREGGKHRITGTRVYRELVDEGLTVGERTVRRYLAERRRAKAEVYIPLMHRAGDEVQVDFFEVTVEVLGERMKAWKFLMRLMYSKRDFVEIYERCDQVSFLDGHVRGFEEFEGVPKRGVYDNLTSAVKRLVGLRDRELTERFKAMTSHYVIEPCFARPGEGHDKGGVEGRGKGIRLQHMTPIVRGSSLGDISAGVRADIGRRWAMSKDEEGRSLSALFEEERGLLRSLPAVPFEARNPVPVMVSRGATVRVEGAAYSVPSHWARLDAMAYVGPRDVRIVCRGEEQVHPRQKRGARRIVYRNYLKELAKKPQAVRQVAPELMAELGEPYGQLWQMLEETHGGLKAGRILAGILGAINDHGEAVVTPALVEALAQGRFGEDGAVDLLGIASQLPAQPVLDPAKVPAVLRMIEVPMASAAEYDVLLRGGVS